METPPKSTPVFSSPIAPDSAMQAWFSDSKLPTEPASAHSAQHPSDRPATSMKLLVTGLSTFFKSFLAGYGLRVLLKLIPLLIASVRQAGKAAAKVKAKGKVNTNAIRSGRTQLAFLPHVIAILTGSPQVRFGLFCGSYIALYKTLLEATRHWAARPTHCLSGEEPLNVPISIPPSSSSSSSSSSTASDAPWIAPDAAKDSSYAPFSRRTPSLMNLKTRALEPYEPTLHRVGHKSENRVYSEWATVRGLMFGALAGLTIVTVPAPTRVSISLFFTVRALEVAARYAARMEIVPDVYNADVFVMMAASAQVLWAWLFKKPALDPSYARFLDIHGGRSEAILRGVESYMTGIPLRHVPELQKLFSAHGLALDFSHPQFTCHLLHPGQSSCVCGQFAFWKQSFRRSIPVYLPVYLAPMLIFHYRSLAKDPASTVLRSLFGVLRSSLFLSSYCTFAWASVCLSRKVFGVKTSLIGIIAGIAAGCALWFEKKGRRIELAMYVMMQALETFHHCCVDWKIYTPVPYGEVLLFSISSGIILQAYLRHPELLSSTYRSVLNRVVGQIGTDTPIQDRRHE